MAYIEWDYTVITSMVEKQGWDLPDRESEEWNKFNDELGEKMRGCLLYTTPSPRD